MFLAFSYELFTSLSSFFQILECLYKSDTAAWAAQTCFQDPWTIEAMSLYIVFHHTE